MSRAFVFLLYCTYTCIAFGNGGWWVSSFGRGLSSILENGLATVIEDVLYAAKTKPCVVVDGSGKAGFKKWRKNTMHPTPVHKTMTAAQLLVRTYLRR